MIDLIGGNIDITAGAAAVYRRVTAPNTSRRSWRMEKPLRRMATSDADDDIAA